MPVELDDKRSVPKIVGVICTNVDLRRATRMRSPPDLFELRLDTICARNEEISSSLEDLRAPLIITARHPLEGGLNQLSLQKRRRLLLRFLSYAAYVDIELRSAGALAPIIKAARANGIRIILSFHDFNETPNRRGLDKIARAAESLGADLLKVATRTDTPAQLATLLEFFRFERRMKVAAMGIGHLGAIARRELFRLGSVLNYGHLGRKTVTGQPSVVALRRWKFTVSG
jgi:3-dehydroquinate dehydratase I